MLALTFTLISQYTIKVSNDAQKELQIELLVDLVDFQGVLALMFQLLKDDCSFIEDKITKEAAMAAGETSGQNKPRTVVSSAAGRRRAEATEEPTSEAIEADPEPLVKEGDAEFEKLLAEEEAIEASTKDSHETPHFRGGDGD